MSVNPRKDDALMLRLSLILLGAIALHGTLVTQCQ